MAEPKGNGLMEKMNISHGEEEDAPCFEPNGKKKGSIFYILTSLERQSSPLLIFSPTRTIYVLCRLTERNNDK
jgi:hypothetical protein